MLSFDFLPAWPPRLSPLAWAALLLLAAIIAGEAVRRITGASRILGYLLVGIAFGPSGFGVLSSGTLAQLRLFHDIALGLVLFELGQRVELDWLRRNPSLLAASVLEAGLSCAAVFGALLLCGLNQITAAAAAVLAVSTSPALVLTVIKDTRAQGQVTERITLLAALNTMYAVIGLALIFGWLHLEAAHPLQDMLLQPLYLVFGSLLAAALLAAAMLGVLRWFGRRPLFQFALTVAFVLLAVATAEQLNLSVPLTLLLLGVLARAQDRERHFVALRFGESATLFIVLLFAFDGTRLQFEGWQAALPIALAFIAARFAGKLLPVMLLARPSNLPLRKAALVGVGLMPMSGVALLMLEDLVKLAPELSSEISASVFLAVTVLAFLGPPALQFALGRAGDVLNDTIEVRK